MTVYSFNLYIWINSTVLVMGRDLFIFAMLSPAELKRRSKDPALTGSISEDDDDDDDDDGDDDDDDAFVSYV